MRLMKYDVTEELVGAMFKTTSPDCWFRIHDGVPPTAEFVRAFPDPDRHGVWCLVFADESFPEAHAGHEIPTGPAIGVTWRGPSVVGVY